MRSGRDSNPRIAVLQTAVLPLHHRTLERTYSRQWIANLQSLIGYSRAGLGHIIVLPFHHQASEEQYNTAYYVFRISSSIFWRCFSPKSSSKSTVGRNFISLFFFKYSLKSVRTRFANISAGFSNFSGNTEKNTVTFLRSGDMSACVTVISD